MRTVVTTPSRRIQARAICARVWPRRAAISLRARIFPSFSSVRAFSFKKRPSVRMRLSAGMPFKYRSVSRPCSKGQKATMPLPRRAEASFSPFCSMERLKME